MADSLYCICRKPYESLQFMIQCDSCEEWFHGSCVGIEEHQAPDIERYHCPECTTMHGPLTLKKRRNWHRHDYSELDDGSKAIQTGTVKFLKELKNRKFPNGDQVILKLRGRDLTLDYLEKNGFNKPLKIEKKDGLGLVVPDSSFSIIDVERHVGSVRELDVIDVSRQEDYKMKMREWTEYFLSPVRKKTMNVISLEFTNSSLSKLVHAPSIVRELDWANHVWPSDAFIDDGPHKKPLVAKYCLMGVKDCYTDFHVDFGGTSVWYHVLWGEKVFFFVAPTKANLQQYEKWVTSAHQSEIFFGDLVEKCYRCTLKAGQTLFIPTGWIHAVFTPMDTLVFGGNFLHSLSIGLQLDVYELEMKLKTPEKFRFPCCETMNWYAAVYMLDKIKAVHESGKKAPQYLVKGMQDMVESLKRWTTKGDPMLKQHKFFIPDGVQPSKLIKSIIKELKKAEKTSLKPSLIPPSPRKEDNASSPSVSVDSSKPVIKIKKPKPQKTATASAREQQRPAEDSPSGYHCEIDTTKPVMRIANPATNQDRDRHGDPLRKGICLRISNPAANQEGMNFEDETLAVAQKGKKKGPSSKAASSGAGVAARRKEKSLSESLPSLKLKIPIASAEESEAADLLNLSAPADSGLKLVVSNGKIISNNNNMTQKTRKITGKQFQPLIQEGAAQDTAREKAFSCTPSQKGLRLKLSKNGMQSDPRGSSESEEMSDDELAFSLGGTPIFNTSNARSTLGNLGTTQGLYSTGASDRVQQPVALLSPNKRNFKAEIEEAKLLLFGAEKMSESTELLAASQRGLAPGLNSQGSLTSSQELGPSRLNSKRAHSASEDEDEESDEEDLGFGDSDYFKDTKYVYPPLAEMTDEEKGSWKPGQKKKKSERVDATWNPKSKVVCSPSKDQRRPVRQTARRSNSCHEGGLLNSPPPTGTGSTMQLNASSLNKPEPTAADIPTHPEGSAGAATSGEGAGPSSAKVPSKRGRHKTVTTTKQRLAKILKLDKSGRFMR